MYDQSFKVSSFLKKIHDHQNLGLTSNDLFIRSATYFLLQQNGFGRRTRGFFQTVTFGIQLVTVEIVYMLQISG